MKREKFLLAMVLMTWCTVALAADEYKYVTEKGDTVEIVFGENSKIIILVDSEEDLEKLRQFDVNAMIDDLNLELENETSGNQVVIRDESGDRYLREKEVDVEIEEEMELEEEIEEAAEEQDEENEEDEEEAWWDKKHDKEDYQDKMFIGKRTMHKSVFDFGMNNYVEAGGGFPDENGAPYTVKPWGSWFVSLGPSFQTNIAGPLAVEWGGNVSWYNFKYQDEAQRIDRDDNGVFWSATTEPSPEKSKLTVAYLNASVVPMLDFGYKPRHMSNDDGDDVKRIKYDSKNIRLGLGGYFGYRIDSYSKFVYRDGGKQKDHIKNNYYLENFRYGLRFVLGYDEVDIFVNYDLNPLFSENRGPDLNAFSFGLSF